MRNRYLIFLFALLAALPGFGQTPGPAKKAAAPSARVAAVHAAQTDAQIEKAIRERFADSKIAADKFEVHVQGGRATITGTTTVLQHKGTATRLARAAGAADVVNNIQPSEDAKQKAGANLAQGRRRAQIKRGETTARSERR